VIGLQKINEYRTAGQYQERGCYADRRGELQKAHRRAETSMAPGQDHPACGHDSAGVDEVGNPSGHNQFGVQRRARVTNSGSGRSRTILA
jgi:hypothetical protein